MQPHWVQPEPFVAVGPAVTGRPRTCDITAPIITSQKDAMLVVLGRPVSTWQDPKLGEAESDG
jgi:hypothetical protein